MAGAVDDGNARKDDLARLTGGADRLADGLAQLDTTPRTADPTDRNPGSGPNRRTEGGPVSAPAELTLGYRTCGRPGACVRDLGLRPLAEQADGAIATIDPWWAP